MAAATYVLTGSAPHLWEQIAGTKPTSNVAPGTLYTDLTGATFVWNGSAWVQEA